MAKHSILILGLFLISAKFIAQHRPLSDYEALINDISRAIGNGDKRALRDLGTLLDFPENRQECVDILKNNTLFPLSQIALDESLDKATFLNFYYQHEQEIKFSSIAHVFYLGSLSSFKVNFELVPFEEEHHFDPSEEIRKLSDELDLALSSSNFSAAITKIVGLGNLDVREAFDKIISLVGNKTILKAKQGAKEGISQAIYSQLSKDPRMKSLDAMLFLLQKEAFPANRARKYLMRQTNVYFAGTINNSSMFNFYAGLIDSLGTFEDLRHHGYKKYFNYGMEIFEHPVDYYGQILAQAGDYPWIESNAIQDLKKIGQSRALMYLAANIFKDRNENHDDYEAKEENIIKTIESITHLKISLENDNGGKTFGTASLDQSFRRNYFLYWVNHFEDYIWEENQKLFINKNENAAKIQSYEKLFRRLSSRKDSIALAAFKELCKGDPIQIAELSDKYRQLLRSYNDQLPSFQYNFLEALTKLTDYYQKNGILIEPDGKILQLLNELEKNLSPKERFQIENEVLAKLDLDQITSLEYAACLHEPNRAFNFSMGRIIDKFYSTHWDQIINSEEQLRNYLKKSYLFEKIGIIGVCNAYLRKFGVPSPELASRLQLILQVEGDPDIANQIAQLIDRDEPEEDYSLEAFIENPSFYEPRDIKLLPEPNSEQGISLAKMIQTTESMQDLKKIFFYLRFNSNPSMVPQFFQSINDERTLSMRNGEPVTIGMAIVPILENIYNHKFPREEGQIYNKDIWQELWLSDSTNYKNWGLVFLENELSILETNDTISITSLNEITESYFYEPKLKKRCLKLLGKVHPVRNIKKFDIEPGLDIKTDLNFFRGFRFNYKVLDDIAKLFEVKEPEIMLSFLMDQAQVYSVENLGSFYNKLFPLGWFQQFLNSSGSNATMANSIARSLREYLDQSDFISEYEEENTILHIAQLENIGKPLVERLSSSILNDMDDAGKFKVQQDLISGISFDDIQTVVVHADQLSRRSGLDPLEFLRRDFGLPIFEIEDSKAFLKDLKNLSQKEFYLKYIEQFGVNIQKGNQLDLEKIYELLEFEIVTPFVGDGGQKRDHFVYGVIKVLELTFNTRLGFHEKLNENQSFYTYTSTKRALAWMDFLQHKGLEKSNTQKAPSFNILPVTSSN